MYNSDNGFVKMVNMFSMTNNSKNCLKKRKFDLACKDKTSHYRLDWLN